jgi:hypothetical protein
MVSLTYKRLTPPTTLKKNKRRKTRVAAPFPDSKCVCVWSNACAARADRVCRGLKVTYIHIDR